VARIQRRFSTATRDASVGDLVLELTMVADPDAILERVETEQPFWATAWDSAFAVAELLAAEDLTGTCVLDLGCGMGLAGAVAAARGASVLMADAAPPALLFATLNAWPWRARARTRRLDWRADRLSEQFDRIIGADILYDRAEWPHLEQFWREHLKPGGSIWLGEPGRGMADEFPQWLQTRHWRLCVQEVPVPGNRRPVRIFVGTPDRDGLGLSGPVEAAGTCGRRLPRRRPMSQSSVSVAARQ
jgi:predicted nicotinamide N-methyase